MMLDSSRVESKGFKAPNGAGVRVLKNHQPARTSYFSPGSMAAKGEKGPNKPLRY